MSSVESSSSMEDDVVSDTTSSSSPFPVCRRDANCKCQICIASINATLDLLPMSVQRSSRINKSSPPRTPIFFNPSIISTPESENSRLMPLRTDFGRKIKGKKVELGFGLMIMKWVLILCLVLIGELGFSLVVTSRVLETKLSKEMVRNLSERSLGFHDVKEQLGFLKKEIQVLVGDRESEASNWEIIQDGLILKSRYQLYKSGTEEVSIWGWPLQTSGLLKTRLSSRSFTILSGRVTEWSNGELSFSIRKANTSWEQEKWSSSVLHLDQNTWILEYKRSFVFENTKPFSSAMEFLKFRMISAFQWTKQLWKSFTGHRITPT